ncbi:MAG: hypothetical protein ABR564_07750 [Candidatus Dormibacteria bacterium]
MALQRYDPPAELTDFDGIPGQRDRWSDTISGWFDSVVDADVRKRIHPGDPSQYFNQLTSPVAGLMEQRIVWNAFPATLRVWFGRAQALEIADRLRQGIAAEELPPGAAEAATINLAYRLQDEYCEWHVTRDDTNRIVRVTFTSEPPEYWQALHGETLLDPVTGEALYPFPGDRNLVLQLYRDLVSPQVAAEDLVFSDDVYRRPGDTTPIFRKGEHNPYNRWNTTDGIVHLTNPVNSLAAEIMLAGDATVLRADRSGGLLSDPEALICCAGYGGPNRASDPTIGGGVNQLARIGCPVTLRNPVGLYLHHLDMAGFSRPDGGPIDAAYFRVVRGSAADGLIERAVFEVPAGEGFTVSDLRIAGEPILFGGQISERITMNLVALAGAPGTFSNQPVACSFHCCADDEHPSYMGRAGSRGCGQGQHPVFQWCADAPQATPLQVARSRVADLRIARR